MYCSADVAAPKSGPSSLATPAGRPSAERLWRRIRALRQCTLTSRTPYGEPHSRTVRLQNRSLREGDPLCFFIERGSDLVLDVRTDPQVTLDFTEADGRRISVRGKAGVLGNLSQTASELRHGGCLGSAWLASDERERLALLRVDIEQVRYLDAPRASLRPAPRQLALA
ncbi:pyridoxamine 5'-phosphate oxidase family protein [Ideonella sp. BN130291]|uniref:pyridoxamine 5'-phosphate oxidase family protein n=1 Tax=Ideonella sp. BN130291 TaxID=3112940 RepID=UPI002E25E410|nr:pyridoxamine 5'-phosphate oxidase family protein [Ideonella sp. BN130291]